MRKALFLFSILGLSAGPLAAQTEPAAPTPAATPGAAPAQKSPWLIFDQPLDTVPAKRSRPFRGAAPDSKPTRTAPAQQAAEPDREMQGAQGANYVPLDPDTYRLIDRYVIKLGPDAANDPHTSVRPYTRAATARLARRMQTAADTGAVALSKADQFNAEYLRQDNWAHSGEGPGQSTRPFLNYFFRNPIDFYHVAAKDFTLRVNPVTLLQIGRDNQSTDGLRYVNTRGLQVEGTIDQRLGFYTFLADNQLRVPLYVRNRVERDQILPHEGFFKPFRDAQVGQGSQYDFFSARGGITYAAGKHVNLQLAHDRNFIGNGYRSLILSDYSAPYFFLKANTRIWKFNYQNLFAELTAHKENADQVYPKKYLALHHLSFDVTPTFNIGVFESTVLGGRNAEPDSVVAGGKIVRGRAGSGFELQYLNPVIFYRAVEQQVGSADNAVLGLDFKWNILRTAQLYGQVVLDEFKLSEIRSGKGWVSNKQAVQLGGKYIDVAGLRNVDLQVEVNYIRPYTYQHKTLTTAYTHYDQPLAHPMGANLTEVLGVLSYQPLPRLMLVGKAFYTVQGLDYGRDAAGQVITTGPIVSLDPQNNPITIGRIVNYGGNPQISYDLHPTKFDNRTGQGNKSTLIHADFTATYQPRLNLFLDAKLIARNQKYSLTPAANRNEVYASLALRWNIAQRLHEF